jgi:hypothetical protein
MISLEKDWFDPFCYNNFLFFFTVLKLQRVYFREFITYTNLNFEGKPANLIFIG